MFNPSIFVSVAAFNESFLAFTLEDALNKASHPERLVFGVVDQFPSSRRNEVRAIFKNPRQLRYLHVNPVEARGVCWARSLVQSLFCDETYYLQIDSHTLFEKNWDLQLIEQYQHVSSVSDKPILTVYPYGFEFDENLNPLIKVRIGDKTTLGLRVHPDTDFSDSSLVLRFRAEHIHGRGFLRGFHIAGGFIFTDSRWVNEVPYDPRLYFHGEEQNLAIRSFTRGWDILHPSIIPIYHLYKMPNQSYNSHHWHTEWESQRDIKWPELKKAANLRLNALFEGKTLGCFGLGSQRNLSAFAALSGIDYLSRKINRVVTDTFIDLA